jgi:CubicO group peptidase (beta-lactamase class C family)
MTSLRRREFLVAGSGLLLASRLQAAAPTGKFEPAAEVLRDAVADGQVKGAVLCVRHDGSEFTHAFGSAKSPDAMFLLGSVSKPIAAAAVVAWFDREKLSLDDPAKKYLPEFTGEGREAITVRQLLTHVSGLPDQLPENERLRSSHAGLEEFVKHAVRTPLLFKPASRYGYSSMAILLAAEAAQRASGTKFSELLEDSILKPLGMEHSALGVGRFRLDDLMPCQLEGAAPESGGGDAAAKEWGWNSPYWRKLASPWGGVHASATDVARFLGEFLERPKALAPKTAAAMIANHNPPGITPRGLGFALGSGVGVAEVSDKAFGHTGSTGTIAWADPATNTLCVVLTTLPSRAIDPHPRTLTAARVREMTI